MSDELMELLPIDREVMEHPDGLDVGTLVTADDYTQRFNRIHVDTFKLQADQGGWYLVTDVTYQRSGKYPDCLQVSYFAGNHCMAVEYVPLDEDSIYGQEAYLWVLERCRLGTLSFHMLSDDRISVDRFLEVVNSGYYRPGQWNYYFAEPYMMRVSQNDAAALFTSFYSPRRSNHESQRTD